MYFKFVLAQTPESVSGPQGTRGNPTSTVFHRYFIGIQGSEEEWENHSGSFVMWGSSLATMGENLLLSMWETFLGSQEHVAVWWILLKLQVLYLLEEQ